MKKFFSTTLVIALFALMCVPVFMFADDTGGKPAPTPTVDTGGKPQPTPTPSSNAITWKITNPLRAEIGDDISSIIGAVMKSIVMPLASILVVLAILYSGFKFVIAQGNAKELEDARTGLVWVLIGSLILLGAYGISDALKDTVDQIVPIK
ncbi:MAG: hypothetical protein RL292_470 [Candidatus Parcubacteria bacterium]|jgi:hypothetical protein